MKFKVVPRDKIEAGRYDLRFHSGEEEINDLAHSIEVNGLICPLAVREEGDKYPLIAGRRRLRALDKLGRTEIECAVLDEGDEVGALVKGIVENTERVGLSPLERALAFQRIIETYGLNQKGLADSLSRTPSYVSHHLRLLQRIHKKILQYLHERKLVFGHAQALMTLKDKNVQLELADRAIKDNWTVEDIWVEVDLARPTEDLTDREKSLNEIERDIIKEFKKEWRTKINVQQGKKEETVSIRFASRSELLALAKRLLKALG